MREENYYTLCRAQNYICISKIREKKMLEKVHDQTLSEISSSIKFTQNSSFYKEISIYLLPFPSHVHVFS